MPETLTGTNSFGTTLDAPKDGVGEKRTAASLYPALQRLLDNTVNLDAKATALLATLNALIVTNSDDDTAIASAYQAVTNHLSDASAAHAASAISFGGSAAGDLPAGDLEGAMDAVATRVKALEVEVGFAISLSLSKGQTFNPGYETVAIYPLGQIAAGKSVKLKNLRASRTDPDLNWNVDLFRNTGFNDASSIDSGTGVTTSGYVVPGSDYDFLHLTQNAFYYVRVAIVNSSGSLVTCGLNENSTLLATIAV